MKPETKIGILVYSNCFIWVVFLHKLYLFGANSAQILVLGFMIVVALITMQYDALKEAGVEV